MKTNLMKNGLFGSRKIILIVLILLTGIFIPRLSGSAEAPPLEETISHLQQLYEKTQDFQAGFIQETTVKSIRKTDVEEGIVYFKNPRQMLWDYKKPKAKKLIINSQKAWLYLPQDKAVYTLESEKLFKSEALIKFLSGLGKLRDDFTIKYAVPAVDKNGNYQLHLYPKEKGPAYQYLLMTIDKQNGQILQVRFDDVMGNSTSLTFSGIKMNAGLSSKMFQFQPTADISVFKMP